jgi:hypothetical protein
MTWPARVRTVGGMFTTHSPQQPLRRAGLACVAGATILAVGAFVTHIAQTSTDVSDKLWRYPWSSETALALFSLWAVAQALLLIGLFAFRRVRAAGHTRSASLGVAIALGGTALILVGHLASIPIRDQSTDDTWPQLIGGVYGLGTVLTAIGLLLAGRGTIRDGIWRGWRRFAPFATGIWTVALIGLQFTPALPSAVAVYGLCFAAIGVALATTPRPSTTTAHTLTQPA